MKRSGLALPFAALAVAALISAVPAMAHHSFVMFDTTRTVQVTGTVTSFEWTNPHAYIEIDVAGTGGDVMHWSVEMGSPSILMQSGWKFSTLKKGQTVSVEINPLRNGDPGGLLIQAKVPDGRTLGNGPGRGPGQGNAKGKGK